MPARVVFPYLLVKQEVTTRINVDVAGRVISYEVEQKCQGDGLARLTAISFVLHLAI